MSTNKLSTFRGDSFTLNLNFTDSNDAVINITGWTVFFTIKSKVSDADAAAVVSKTITSHTNAAQGQTVVSLSPTDTAALDGEYFYDIQFKKADGTVKTLVKSNIRFEEDVTIRTS